MKDLFYMQSLGDHYINKFLDYFQRNNLVAFTIKKTIEKDEFERFIRVLVERYMDDETGKAVTMSKDRFSEILYKNKVFNITCMHPDEIVGRNRKIPWGVQMALSRLRKDLKIIQIYCSATRKSPTQVRDQIITDVMRPLREAEVLKDMLFNTDLAVEGLEAAAGWDIDQELLRLMPKRMLAPVTKELLNDLKKDPETLKYEQRELDYDYLSRSKSVLSKITPRLLADGSEELWGILEQLASLGIVERQALPAALQEKIRIDRLVDAFIENENSLLMSLDRTPDQQGFMKQVEDMQAMFHVLMKRRAFPKAHRILELLEHFGQDRSNQSKIILGGMALQAISKLGTSIPFDALVRELIQSKGEERQGIVQLIRKIGRPCVPHLLKLMRNDERPHIQREAGNIVAGVTEDISDLLMAEISKEGHPWHYYKILTSIIGGAKYSAAIPKIIPLLRHENPKVREEVVYTLSKLKDSGSDKFLVKALDDEDAGIRLKAVASLGNMGSRQPRFLSFIHEALRLKTLAEKQEGEEIQIKALEAARSLGNVEIEKGVTLEKVLWENLASSGKFGFLKALTFKHPRVKSEKVRALMADVLGHIGTSQSIEVLEKLRGDQSSEIRSKAVFALERLQERYGSN